MKAVNCEARLIVSCLASLFFLSLENKMQPNTVGPHNTSFFEWQAFLPDSPNYNHLHVISSGVQRGHLRARHPFKSSEKR